MNSNAGFFVTDKNRAQKLSYITRSVDAIIAPAQLPSAKDISSITTILQNAEQMSNVRLSVVISVLEGVTQVASTVSTVSSFIEEQDQKLAEFPTITGEEHSGIVQYFLQRNHVKDLAKGGDTVRQELESTELELFLRKCYEVELQVSAIRQQYSDIKSNQGM